MADDARKLDLEVWGSFPSDPGDRWTIALERLAQYDHDGLSLDAEGVLAEFQAAIAARSDALA